MYQRLVWNVALAVTGCFFLVSVAKADSDPAVDVLDRLLAEVQLDIDVLNDLIDKSQANPGKFVVLEVDGQFVGVEQDTIDETVAVGATVLHAVIQSSPTAAQMIGERFGQSLVESVPLASYGFSTDFGQIFGDIAGSIASKSRGDITEDMIRARIEEAVTGYMKPRRRTADQLQAALRQNQDIYNAIDILIDEMHAIADEPPVAENDKGADDGDVDDMAEAILDGSGCRQLQNDANSYDASWTWYGSGGIGSTDYEAGGVICTRGGYYVLDGDKFTHHACDENWANCQHDDYFDATVTDVDSEKDENGAYVDYHYRDDNSGSVGRVRMREPLAK